MDMGDIKGGGVGVMGPLCIYKLGTNSESTTFIGVILLDIMAINTKLPLVFELPKISPSISFPTCQAIWSVTD